MKKPQQKCVEAQKCVMEQKACQVYTGLILLCLVLIRSLTLAKDITQADLSVRAIGRSLAQCFGSGEKLKCLEMQLVNALEAAVQDNSSWHYSDFVAVEKKEAADTDNATFFVAEPAKRSLSDTISERLLRLAQSRSIRLQLPQLPPQFTQRGIADGIESLADLAITPSASLGELLSAADEGRKKKDKDKNMAMMGGMAMMAMFAQMFLGKVILIAGAAFVMAKIALLVSILGSLKQKGSSGSSGSKTEHVIVTGGGGGGGGHGHGGGHDSSGWHRSMPYDEHPQLELASEEHHHSDYAPPPHEEESHGEPPSSKHYGSSGGFKPSGYNYEITENESEDFRRQGAAGFL